MNVDSPKIVEKIHSDTTTQETPGTDEKSNEPTIEDLNKKTDNDPNLPENFQVFQNNKEMGDKSDKGELKENHPCTTTGNDESQCSVDEPSSEVQTCYWYIYINIFFGYY